MTIIIIQQIYRNKAPRSDVTARSGLVPAHINFHRTAPCIVTYCTNCAILSQFAIRTVTNQSITVLMKEAIAMDYTGESIISSSPPISLSLDQDVNPATTTTLIDLGVPDIQLFETYDILLAALQTNAKQCGYGLVVESSRPAHGVVKLACDLHGKQRNHRNLTDEDRVRKRRPSRKCDCPMRVRCWRMDDGLWTFASTQPMHNHPASDDPKVHVVHRKRKADVLLEVQTSVVEGQKTKEVLENLLKEDQGACYSARDIYNDRAKVKRAMRAAAVDSCTDPRLRDAEWLGVEMAAQQVPRMISDTQDPGLRLSFSRIMVWPEF